MKRAIVLAVCVGVAVAVSACRKEVEHKPMKLGADVPAVQVSR